MKKIWKIILIIIIVIFAIGILGSIFGGGDKNNPNSSNTPTKTVTKTPEVTTNITPSKALPTPTEEPKQTQYKAGTYKVGSDLPAGEYVLFCDNNLLGYMEVSSDSSGSLDSIIANENFSYNSIVTIKDGQYFKMQGSYAVPLAEVTTLDTSGDGMFKIGTHLPAGEYKLEADDNITGYGYYEVSSDSSHVLSSIVSNDNFEGNTYVTVSDGQYLKISSAKIIK